MPKIAYEPNTMRDGTFQVAMQAARIAQEYDDAGYELTLRQLYYQFVSRGFIENTQRSYKRLGDIVDKARMCGIIDWNHIVDPTRVARGLPHLESPGGAIRKAAYTYWIDKWVGQQRRIELWVEKEALASVVSRVATTRDCTFLACKGYLSSSAMWQSAQRIGEWLDDGQDVVILHLGDHDPSGVDMTRDNYERLAMLIENDRGYQGDRLRLDRIALNMDQIRQYNPPPNPAKMTDSRAEGYVSRYGIQSWELDALPPDVLVNLMNDQIDQLVDMDLYAERARIEETHREQLRTTSRNWPEIAEHIDDQYGHGA